MPNAAASFVVAADPARVAGLLRDLSFLAMAVPNVVQVEPVDSTTAMWTVDIRLGPLKRKAVFRGELTKATDRSFEFRATGSEATIDGAIDLTPTSENGTEVSLRLNMKGAGPLRAVIDSFLARRIDEDAQGFAAALRERLSRPTANG